MQNDLKTVIVEEIMLILLKFKHTFDQKVAGQLAKRRVESYFFFDSCGQKVGEKKCQLKGTLRHLEIYVWV